MFQSAKQAAKHIHSIKKNSFLKTNFNNILQNITFVPDILDEKTYRLHSRVSISNHPTQFTNMAIHDYGDGNLLNTNQNSMLYIDIIKQNNGYTTKHLEQIRSDVIISNSLLDIYHHMYLYADELGYFEDFIDGYNTDVCNKEMIIDIILSKYHYENQLDSIMQHNEEEPYILKNTSIRIPCLVLEKNNILAPQCNIYAKDEKNGDIYRKTFKVLEENEGFIHDYTHLKTIIEPPQLIDNLPGSLVFLQANARVKNIRKYI